jgi:hypothetical protein
MLKSSLKRVSDSTINAWMQGDPTMTIHPQIQPAKTAVRQLNDDSKPNTKFYLVTVADRFDQTVWQLYKRGTI